MVKDYKKLLRISQVLNSTFGSDGPGAQIVNGTNVKLEPVDDKLIKAKATMNVSFRTDQMMREMTRKYREEAIERIKASLERVAKEYKAKFDENINLSFDEKAIDESTEFYQINQYTAQSRAFYRVSVLVKVD